MSVSGMDCPHCNASNPVGTATCGSCRTPLIDSGATLVAQMTPPVVNSDATLIDSAELRRYKVLESMASNSPPSMEIPKDWSIPPQSQSLEEARNSLAAFKPGYLLGNRYEIVQILGQGGMGAVYKARDRELDRTVALKVIRPELAGQPDILQRFKQELILARKITHRNVIRIFDLGDAAGTKFITMEFIEGRDLKGVLSKEGKLAPERAVSIMQQVLLALDAAHTEGVVHRDLKPQNIMIGQDDRASVMDFGIARSLEFGGMTQTGAMIGTPEYMSPEQVRGEPADARSDIFTLGIIFQELLTGILPYQAETAMASMFKRTMERAVPVQQLNPNVPQYLSDIVAKCLEIQPQDRYQSVREINDALEAWKSGAAKPLVVPSQRWTRRALRHRTAISSAATATGLCILVGAGVLIYRAKHPTVAKVAHAPVSVLVADFANQTGDPIFDGTLEPMLNVALEGASFVNAYNRGDARRLAGKLPSPTSKLDEQSARLVAISQGVNMIVTGSLSSSGHGYRFATTAIDAVTGKTLANAEVNAANKDEVLFNIPKIAAPMRKALGDTTPVSAQLAAVQGSFSAGNLDAVHQYGVAMEQQFAGKMDEALQSFGKAVELDPNFARAYSGMAATYGNLGRPTDAQKYAKMALEHIDRMSERERYRTRGEYYIESGNWQKCVEEYGELVKRYPVDNAGHTNAALCYSQLRNWPKAVDEAKQDVDIHADAIGLANLGLFSSYAGDFQNGERTAQRLLQLSPSFEYGYYSLAFSQLGQDQFPKAADTYRKLATVSELGASRASLGLADMDTYEGRFAEAVKSLTQGAAADVTANRQDGAADKYVALAYTQLLLGQKPAAVAAVEKALANSKGVKVRFLAARTYVEAGDLPKAQKLADSLAAEIQPEPQAYAKILAGDAALKKGSAGEAVKNFTDANNLLDTWIGRFDLGRAYLEAGAFTEADSEFDRCIKRRGETLALFLDEVPTFSYFPAVYYYQGRVREGLKSPGFADSYRSYLNIRGKSTDDPLVAEIHKRIGQ